MAPCHFRDRGPGGNRLTQMGHFPGIVLFFSGRSLSCPRTPRGFVEVKMHGKDNLPAGDNGIPDPSTWVDPLKHPYLRRKSKSTVYRWLQEGRLKSIRMGVEYITTQNWIDEFILRSSATLQQSPKKARPSQRQRRAQVEQARRNIEARRNRRVGNGPHGLGSETNPQEEQNHD